MDFPSLDDLLMGNLRRLIIFAIANGVFLGIRCYRSKAKMGRILVYTLGVCVLAFGVLATQGGLWLLEYGLPQTSPLEGYMGGPSQTFTGMLIKPALAAATLMCCPAAVLFFALLLVASWYMDEESLRALPKPFSWALTRTKE